MLRENLKDKDSDLHVCHVSCLGKEDWEHLIVVCLKRRDGIPAKVLYVRQNVTEQVRKQCEQTQALQDALMQAQQCQPGKNNLPVQYEPRHPHAHECNYRFCHNCLLIPSR